MAIMINLCNFWSLSIDHEPMIMNQWPLTHLSQSLIKHLIINQSQPIQINSSINGPLSSFLKHIIVGYHYIDNIN